MLKQLYIRNYAIIEELTLEFPQGLTIVTGETGAGKSILLGALNLILGERAEGRLFFHEDQKCIIEAIFDIQHYNLKEAIESEDLDYDETMLIRRELSSNGKSRAFINDSPVNLKTLNSICKRLVDLHQQFDTMQIQDSKFQIKALDALAQQATEVNEYKSIYKSYWLTKQDIHDLKTNKEKYVADQTLWQHQLDELAEVNIVPDMLQNVEVELARLTHAEFIKTQLGAVYQQLEESEVSISSQIRKVQNMLLQAGKYDAKVEAQANRMADLLIETEDIASECERLYESTDLDPQRLVELQNLQSIIIRLMKKHNVQTELGLLDIKKELVLKLERSGDSDERLAQLEKELKLYKSNLIHNGEAISQKRNKSSKIMKSKVETLLATLNMPNSVLEIQLQKLPEPGPNGLEEVKFLFSANKGVVPAEIKQVASGGELSRLSLCIQSLVASSIPLPTMIYDEIDAGVSGQVALQMGHILKNLANEHQVIVITHSPQVAARAAKHYLVAKSVSNGITRTTVEALSQEERINAIAAMLSTNPPTAAAISNAKELIAG